MSKPLLQDMVRVKKSPTDIKNNKKQSVARNTESSSVRNDRIEKVYNQAKRSGRGPKYRIYFVALISIIFLLFALSFLFSGAEITLVPKVEDISLNDNLSAAKNSNVSSPSFDLVVISGEENKLIKGGEIKNVAIAATGTVVVYNSYSFSSQNLDIDTRLEGSNGKIYKTIKKIIVPGMKDSTPGSVEVGIYATDTGGDYNSTPLDFKIFGFKGTPKYSKFYARSKGEITGGFEGKSSVVSSLEKTAVISELKTTLKTELSGKIINQIPSGFILFKDASFLSIDEKDASFTPDKDDMISVNLKGTLYGFLLDEKKLTTQIAKDAIDDYDGSEVYIPNIKDLTFLLSNKDNISFANVNSIDFALSGNPKIVWKIDEKKLISDILGKKKSDFNKILSQYKSIDTAQLSIRPFWKTSFPEESKSVEIIVNYPK